MTEPAATIDPLPLAGSTSTATAAAHAETPGADPTVARLTGGIGNHVVVSFDQLRAAVRPLGPSIDECYRSTANDTAAWRENLMWDLDVSDRGTVTRVTLHDAEYWRGDHIVTATPSPALADCMQRTLRRLVVPAPVRSGWIRLRFET